jgi:hypothetical protein
MWIYLIYWIFVPSLCFISGYVLRSLMTARYRARGTITVTKNETGQTLYVFTIDGDPDEVIASKFEVLFEIHR